MPQLCLKVVECPKCAQVEVEIWLRHCLEGSPRKKRAIIKPRILGVNSHLLIVLNSGEFGGNLIAKLGKRLNLRRYLQM